MKNANSKIEREYLIEHLVYIPGRGNEWETVSELFHSLETLRSKVENVKVRCNDFVQTNYRIIVRTTFTVEEPLERLGMGW